jgi:flagellar basal-body rod protein FlgB
METGLGRDDLLLRLLSASAERARVIAGNISNQNTPGYTRKVLRFEELLRDAIETGRSNLADVQPTIEEDLLTPRAADGNNVNVELETNALRQNRLLYEAYASILGTRFELLRSSVESSR